MSWLQQFGPYIVGIAALLGVLVTLYLGLRKDRGERAAAALAALAASNTLKNQIDQRIDERVLRDMERQDAEIEDVRRDLIAAKAEIKELTESKQVSDDDNKRIKRVVQRWFYELRAWDREGRHGEMPMPSDEDMLLLQLGPPPEPE